MKTGEIAHRDFSFFVTVAFFNFMISLSHTYADTFLHKITFASNSTAVAGRYLLEVKLCLAEEIPVSILSIPVHFPFQPTFHLLYLFYFPFNSCPLSVPAHFPFAVLI